ncbi:hypothetical protein [Pseudomonas aeruginosa]|uniref:hypothetical protein n=1 Tax=Pseudomonas aeruginosa TaxID=287 RepID=UPI00292C8DD1|nr:hypothetical protein [Pseudomonas aeruginosa]
MTAFRELTQQPEAERPELWAVHAQGPDELYAAFNRGDAEKHAAELNCLPVPVSVSAVVIPSPWPPAEHWQYLAEQERDHKNEIAVRLRQFERICEGLPQDAIDGGWTVQGIRAHSKQLEEQLKSALARVAELEKLSRAHDPLRIGLAAMIGTFKTASNPGEESTLRMANQLFDATADARYGDFKNKAIVDRLITGLAAPVAQAQHSVPRAWLDVQAERRRQVEAEGWTPEHDDEHACDEIAAFACFYAMPPAARDWDASSTGYGDTLGEAILPEGWEPKTGDRRRDLVKACALGLAEIERLDRAGISQNPQPGATTASS